MKAKAKEMKQANTHAVLPVSITRSLGVALVTYRASNHTLTQRFGEVVDAAVKSVPAELPKADVTKWIRETITTAIRTGIEAKGELDMLKANFNVTYTNSGKVKADDTALGFYVNGTESVIAASSLAVMISNAGARFKDCDRDFDAWQAMGAERFQSAKSEPKASPNAKGTIAALDKGRKLYAKLYTQKITKAQAEELVRAIAAIVS